MANDKTIFAHRGTNPYVDNTLDAYRWGFNYGADFAETDFRLTKDGILVSYHDILDGGGVENMTYAQVKEKVPTIVTLQELIALTKEMETETGRKLGILVETKTTSYATHEAVIKTLIAEDFADPERIIIQSFGTELEDVRNILLPQYGVDLPLVQLTNDKLTPENIAHWATYADGVAPQMVNITAESVAAAQAAGLTVNGWTVNGSLADVENALKLGVDGIIADYSQWTRPALEQLANNANVVYGTADLDIVSGTAGADKLYGMQGQDILRAGAGNDTLYGDAGNDLLFGATGNDHLVGGSGNDYLAGGEGADVLDGGAGNDVIVATGDEVVFRAGDGIDLVSLDATSRIRFEGAAPAGLTVLRDGDNLIIRSGQDALVLLNGADPAHQPAAITTADGQMLTGAALAAMAVPGSDPEVTALMPGLLDTLGLAPAFATPSEVPVGTDLVTQGDFDNGVLTQAIENAETGAIYRLSFSLADLPTGEDGVRVRWGGRVVYEGVPDASGSDLHFIVKGGAGDGSNTLTFEGAGASFGATLDDVHLVKLSDPVLPVAGNVAPAAPDAAITISQDLPFIGKAQASDADGDALTYSLGNGPAHGSLVFKADGTYQYTPAAGFSGADGFSFLVNDRHGNIVESAIAITVGEGVLIGTDLMVNGSFEDISINGRFADVPGELSPAAWGYYTDQGVFAGWADVKGNRAEIASLPSNQNDVKAKDGSFFFDLDGYGQLSEIGQTIHGVEQGAAYDLKFSIADGDARTDDDGVQVFWGGELVFEGMPGSNNWQDITLHLQGGTGDGSNTLVFKGTGVENWFGTQLDDVRFVKTGNPGDPAPANDKPDALDATGEGVMNAAITGQLSASDTDQGTSLIFGLGEGPAHGTVRVYADGTYKYTPTKGYTGSDSFTYTVNDAHGLSDTASVTLTVEKPAGVPVGTDLIVNGSFEDLSESANNNGPSDWGYRNLDGAILGWKNEANSRLEQHSDHYGGVTAKDGRYWIDLDHSGFATPNRITQAIANVEEGASYKISFSLSDSDNVRNDDGVRVLWNGEVIFEGMPPQRGDIWTTYTFDVVGGSGNGANKLEFIDTGVTDSWGAGVALDDVHFVKTGNAPGSEAPVGTSGDDTLTGTTGADTINGLAGDDVIAGLPGNDTIDGGEGDDILDGGEGDDLLRGGAGDDRLIGGAGVDILVGGAGDDRLDGGAGIDTADYSTDTVGVTVDLASGEAFGDEAGADELTGIENVIGGAGNDTLTGDDGANRLVGGNGNDILHGGAGDDVLVGGAGDDVIDGGEGFDTLDLSGATGPIMVDLAGGRVSGTGIGTDSFTNIEKLLFGAGDDIVTGGNGDDTFDGGAGNDTLTGGAGNDTLSGGAGGDTLDGGSGNDVLDGALGADIIKAGSGDDRIDGGEGNDVIDAGSGDDIILAGAGNDRVDGGSGNDRIEGGAGDDILTGGSGHDAFVFAAGFGHDTVTDFRITGSSSDVLEFSTEIFAGFDAAIAAADQVGADTVFTLDADHTLTLSNVQMTSLQADDFRFV